MGGPCDFSVSPSPFGLDFGTLDFGTSDLGLTIIIIAKAELSKIDNLGLGELDCNSPGDLTKAAKTLEEVATLIDEIGLDSLQQKLGINLPFSP